MMNNGEDSVRISQQNSVPDGVEIRSYTFSYYNGGQITREQERAQTTGGMHSLQSGEEGISKMTYINHPDQVLEADSKIFHMLDSRILVLGDNVVSGEISTPNFPDNYPNGSDISWMIAYPEGHTIDLNIVEFETEKCCDHLIVYDGMNTSTSNALAIVDGVIEGNDSSIASTGNALFLRFSSDCLISRSGFRATFVNIPPIPPTPMPCGSVILSSEDSGFVLSPNYPEPYDGGMNCTWEILTSNTTRVEFTVDNFNTNDYDRLFIYDGTPSNPGDLLATLYGSVSSGYSVNANSNNAFLVFNSNSSSSPSNGFNISYEGIIYHEPTTTPVETTTDLSYNPQCHGTQYLTEAPGILSPGYFVPNAYPNDVDCQWRITYPGYISMKFWVHDFSIEYNYDWVRIYNGFGTDSSNLLAQLTGFIEDHVLVATTSSPDATLHFQSDRVGTDKGFYFHVYAGDPDPSLYTTNVPEVPTEPAAGTCSETVYLTNYTGYISPPGYPSDQYENDLDCRFSIQTPPGTFVRMTIEFFELAMDDYLYIHDGPAVNSTVTHTLNGHIPPYTYSADMSSNSALVQFVSNSQNTDWGFNIRYKPEPPIVYDSCGADIYLLDGIVQSPNYPNGYADLLDCYWTVYASSGKCVLFTVIDFMTESCCDYVDIRDGTPSHPSPNRLAHISGDDYHFPKAEILSTTSTAFMNFYSDSSITEKGFSMKFSEVNCDYQASPSRGIAPSNTLNVDPYPQKSNERNRAREHERGSNIIGRNLWPKSTNRQEKGRPIDNKD
uniref:CUB and sushi domain-containing protein 1-like n=1 Tax=Styela clava TaxID=7725 RepID=UPI001939291F|nr:CUB and sushi domain-containing protein 1-like [Styela clava]